MNTRDTDESDTDLARNVLFAWPKKICKQLGTQDNHPNQAWYAMQSGRVAQIGGQPDIAAKFHVNDQGHLTKCEIGDKLKDEILTVRLSAPAVTASGNAPVVREVMPAASITDSVLSKFTIIMGSPAWIDSAKALPQSLRDALIKTLKGDKAAIAGIAVRRVRTESGGMHTASTISDTQGNHATVLFDQSGDFLFAKSVQYRSCDPQTGFESMITLPNPAQQSRNQTGSGSSVATSVVSTVPSEKSSAALSSLKRPYSPGDESSTSSKQRLEANTDATGSAFLDANPDFDPNDIDDFDSTAFVAAIVPGLNEVTMPANREALVKHYDPGESAAAPLPDSSRLSGAVGFVKHLETQGMDVNAFMQLGTWQERNQIAGNAMTKLSVASNRMEVHKTRKEMGDFIQELHVKSGNPYLQEDRKSSVWAERILGWNEVKKKLHRQTLMDQYRANAMIGMTPASIKNTAGLMTKFLIGVESPPVISNIARFLELDTMERETALTSMCLHHETMRIARIFISVRLDTEAGPKVSENKIALKNAAIWSKGLCSEKSAKRAMANFVQHVGEWMRHMENSSYLPVSPRQSALQPDSEWKTYRKNYLQESVPQTLSETATKGMRIFRTWVHLEAWQARVTDTNADPAVGKQSRACVDSWIQWRVENLPKGRGPWNITGYIRKSDEQAFLSQVVTHLDKSHPSLSDAERAVHIDTLKNFRNWVCNVAGQPTASTSTAVIASSQ